MNIVKLFCIVCPVLVLSLMLAGASELPSATQAVNSKFSIQVVMEQQKGDAWERVDAQTVFHDGDAIRFRFRASHGGYLYVLNSTSDKTTSWLFPRAGSAERSRVEQRVEYLIPSGQGAFVVGGSPGFDITYWILSPTPIDSTQPFVPTAGTQASTLEPRCRTEVLRARGLCVDDRAGPRVNK